VFDQLHFASSLLKAGADPYHPSADPDKPNAFEFAADKPWAVKMLKKWKQEDKA